MDEARGRTLSLKRSHASLLFIYYWVLLIAAGTTSIAVFIPGNLPYFDFMGLAIIGSSGIACAGSAIYYFRKLYKNILQGSLVLVDTNDDPKTLATLAYFLARPMFSIIFALLVVIGIRSGLALSSAKHTSIDYGFVQMTMFFSFFVGFLSGRFIRKLEVWGESMIKRLSSGHSDEQ